MREKRAVRREGLTPFPVAPGRRRCVSTWSGRWAPRVSCPGCGSWERLGRAEEGSGCTAGGEEAQLHLIYIYKEVLPQRTAGIDH